MTKLFSPGPILVKDDVRRSLLHYDICHRSPEFEKMFQDTQQKILKLYKADSSYYSVIVSGSGTACNETVLSSILKQEESVLLVRNGEFGNRLLEIINKYNIPFIDASFPWATIPNLIEVEKKILANPKIKVIAAVYHETSTGMINPIPELGKLAQKYGKIFYVDCVSAAAGEDIDVIRDHIDICTSVGGKCLGAFPGSAYICAKKNLLESLTEDQCKTVYLNLYKHYQKAVTAHQTPNTPNVNLFWPLNVALTNVVEKETLAGRVARYQTCATVIRKRLADLGCTFLLQDHLSNTVTSVFLPKDIDAHVFLSEMAKRGYTFYIGKGEYEKQNMIQVANMGEIYEQDCYVMLEIFEVVMNKMRNK
jgi:2-aminoethylphosphonate-pyruvate transaminase